MVATICSWHEHHGRAIHELQNRLNHGQGMIVAAPALIETYSVLTRLPAPHRILPDAAANLLEANFIEDVKVVALNASSYRALLRASPAAGISGGRIYDAVIAACARQGEAATLLTFNHAHFMAFAGPDLEIVVP